MSESSEESSEELTGRPRVSRSDQSGLVFPVGRLERKLRQGRYANRISDTASVFLAGVLEYLTAEVMEVSGIVAVENKRKRIAPQHIHTAMKNDPEINDLMKNVTVPQSGAVPNIHPTLSPKAKPNEVAANKQIKRQRIETVTGPAELVDLTQEHLDNVEGAINVENADNLVQSVEEGATAVELADVTQENLDKVEGEGNDDNDDNSDNDDDDHDDDNDDNDNNDESAFISSGDEPTK